ncbi:MAG: MlaD family protein [Nitrospirae bacterium]|nr:MlaD family protein [Nitrospirota bacterium]
MFELKKQLMWSKLKVGAVITLALITLFIVVFFAGGIESLLSPSVELTAQIHDVRGLRKGSPVWLSGVEVGTVKSIKLDPRYGTTVTLAIKDKALHFINKDAQASVLTMGLLGDKYVEISQGSAAAGPIRAGDMIKGASQIELKDVMEVGTTSIQRMSDFINKLDHLVTKIETGQGSISKFLTDPTLYENLKDATKNLSLTLKDIKDAKGTVKLLMDDPTLYHNLVSASSSLEGFSRKMNDSSGTLKKMIEDPALYDNLLRATTSIEESGTKLNAVLERIDKGEGVAGALVKDKELSKDLKETVVELKGLVKDLREHPKKYLKFSLF